MQSVSIFLMFLVFVIPGLAFAEDISLAPIERLGKSLFFDKTLSDPPGQGCVTCHNPSAGWTGDTSEINSQSGIYPGAVAERAGNRKPPTASYASFSPVFHYDEKEQLFVGGSFWNGRATGWLMGDPIAEQAQMPFVNPVEHNLASAAVVVDKVSKSSYGDLFRAIFGRNIADNTVNAYNAIGKALAAYQSSAEVNAFTSKYDYYLQDPAKYPLSEEELLGLKVFEDEKKGNCSACHPSRPGPDGEPPVFTDFTYDNLGFPLNMENPWFTMPSDINPDGAAWIDRGLAEFLVEVPRFAHYAHGNIGKQKVPTLRNVDKRPDESFVKAYGHNGYFKDLKDVVHFYNVRDVLPLCTDINEPQVGRNCWPKPAVVENINRTELGNLGLTEEEELALVAFMRTLSDGWRPPQ